MKNNTLKAMGIAIGAALSLMCTTGMEVHAAEETPDDTATTPDTSVVETESTETETPAETQSPEEFSETAQEHGFTEEQISQEGTYTVEEENKTSVLEVVTETNPNVDESQLVPTDETDPDAVWESSTEKTLTVTETQSGTNLTDEEKANLENQGYTVTETDLEHKEGANITEEEKTDLENQGYVVDETELEHKEGSNLTEEEKTDLENQGYIVDETDLEHKEGANLTEEEKNKLEEQGYNVTETELEHKEGSNLTEEEKTDLENQGYIVDETDLEHKEGSNLTDAEKDNLEDQGYIVNETDLEHKEGINLTKEEKDALEKQGYIVNETDLEHKEGANLTDAEKDDLEDQGYIVNETDLEHKEGANLTKEEKDALEKQGYIVSETTLTHIDAANLSEEQIDALEKQGYIVEKTVLKHKEGANLTKEEKDALEKQGYIVSETTLKEVKGYNISAEKKAELEAKGYKVVETKLENTNVTADKYAKGDKITIDGVEYTVNDVTINDSKEFNIAITEDAKEKYAVGNKVTIDGVEYVVTAVDEQGSSTVSKSFIISLYDSNGNKVNISAEEKITSDTKVGIDKIGSYNVIALNDFKNSQHIVGSIYVGGTMSGSQYIGSNMKHNDDKANYVADYINNVDPGCTTEIRSDIGQTGDLTHFDITDEEAKNTAKYWKSYYSAMLKALETAKELKLMDSQGRLNGRIVYAEADQFGLVSIAGGKPTGEYDNDLDTIYVVSKNTKHVNVNGIRGVVIAPEANVYIASGQFRDFLDNNKGGWEGQSTGTVIGRNVYNDGTYIKVNEHGELINNVWTWVTDSVVKSHDGGALELHATKRDYKIDGEEVVVTSGGLAVSMENYQVKADASSYVANGKTYTADGTVYSADGKTYTADGKTYTADGKTYTADGTTYTADGSTYTADGVLYSADGTTYTADGKLWSADGSTFEAVKVTRYETSENNFGRIPDEEPEINVEPEVEPEIEIESDTPEPEDTEVDEPVVEEPEVLGETREADPTVLGASRNGDVLGAKRAKYAVLGKRRRPQTGDNMALFGWLMSLTVSLGAAAASGMALEKSKKKAE